MINKSTWFLLAMGIFIVLYDVMQDVDIMSLFSGIIFGIATMMPLVDMWRSLYFRLKHIHKGEDQ